MKRFFFILLFGLLIFSYPKQIFAVAEFNQGILSWENLINDGFGRTPPFGSENFFDMYVYNGCVYAGIEGQSTTEGSLVYRSCDGETFTLVSPVGFNDPPENDHVDAFLAYKGYLYVSNAVGNDTFDGFKLWRSPTGDVGSWVQVINNGFGSSKNENLKSLLIFNDQMCGGTWNNDGAGVWCTSNGTDWTQVNTPGFGDTDNDVIWFMTVFDGYLYASVSNSVAGGELWRSSDLSTWTQVGTNGLGYGINETLIRGPIGFKNHLYVFVKDGSGGNLEIKRAADGVNFETLYTFSDTTQDGPVRQAMEVFGEYFYFSTFDSTNGARIYRTKDGTTFTQLSNAGFDGNANTIGGLVQVYGDYLYIGGENTVDGQQVWRARLPLESEPANVHAKSVFTSCRETPNSEAIELFQIDTTDVEAKLFFTPASRDITAYNVFYGLSDYPDANYAATFDADASKGVQEVVIGELYPDAKYHFMVRALNDCASGDWSNTLEAATAKNSQSKPLMWYLYDSVLKLLE